MKQIPLTKWIAGAIFAVACVLCSCHGGRHVSTIALDSTTAPLFQKSLLSELVGGSELEIHSDVLLLDSNITPSYLPFLAGRKFRILTSQQIQDSARIQRHVIFLRFDPVQQTDDDTIFITWDRVNCRRLINDKIFYELHRRSTWEYHRSRTGWEAGDGHEVDIDWLGEPPVRDQH